MTAPWFVQNVIFDQTGRVRQSNGAGSDLGFLRGPQTAVQVKMATGGMPTTLEHLGGEATCLHLDVTKEADRVAAVETAVNRYGKLDPPVNNAGIAVWGHLADTTPQVWDRVMEVNAKGVFLGTKAVIPELRKAGGGSTLTSLPSQA